MTRKLIAILLVATLTGLTSCSSNDDASDGQTTGLDIVIDGDVDCCSAEEARQVYTFLQTVKNVPALNTVIDGKYNVFGYTRTGTFHTGYNEVYFVSTKRSTGNYIKDFHVADISPVMTMTASAMSHGTPASDSVASFNSAYLAVKKGWVSFVMNSSDDGTWTISYSATSKGESGTVKRAAITVDALPAGQDWIKSFRVSNDTYYISLVNPADWTTGTNTIQAFIAKQADPITSPFRIAPETFSVDINPQMPDMGGHSSTGNTSLTKQPDGSYQGTISLTMTGLWRIYLTVKNSNGVVVAGGDDRSLYLDVTI